MALSGILGIASKYLAPVAKGIYDTYKRVEEYASGALKKDMPEAVQEHLAKQHGKISPGERYGHAYVLLIPLSISAVWLAYLVVGSKSKLLGSQPSPVANNLVAILFIFIILYSIFLILFFMSRRKRIEKVKKAKKYSSKRKG